MKDETPSSQPEKVLHKLHSRVEVGWKPDVIWHGWVAGEPVIRNSLDMSEHVICWKATGIDPSLPDNSIHMVRSRVNITCKECLEWIHA